MTNSEIGKILVFTAPSGAGKTTLVRHLLDKFPSKLGFSVSATTRKPRPHEVNGKDYYFLSQEEFTEKIKNHDLFEFEEVYKNQYYGTLKSEVKRIWQLNKIVLFDIDVKGASSIKKNFPNQAHIVFVAPPSPEILFSRLKGRGTEDEASLLKRIQRAKEELCYQNEFDEVLINDDLATSKQQAEEIAISLFD